MRNTLNFLIEASKLKKMPRTGFAWLGIKQPETIGQHIFRVALMNWLLAYKAKPALNVREAIKISLVHDLCEVYAGDMTPYWGLLPKDKKAKRAMLKKWIRLPQKVKEKRQKKKFEKEKKSLEKLITKLPSCLKKEILAYWLKYEKASLGEGKFVKQADKVETLLQALEYWGSKPGTAVDGWWEEIRDLVDHPVLDDFLKQTEKVFYAKQKPETELKFLLETGKLKVMPRKGWVIRKVKNPETIAEHSFLLALSVWILSLLQEKKLNQAKLLKMSLIYEICEVYAGDATPYDSLLYGKNKQAILKRWPRLTKKEKEKIFLKDYRQEKKAIEKITASLPQNIKREMIGLWHDCKYRRTAEGKFVNQAYWLMTYLQALHYFKENKKFPISAWCEQMGEYIEDEFFLRLMKEMEKKLLPKTSF